MKKRTLPRTSRVTDEICKYYRKFGSERDLEKFLRLYSSSSGSQDSCRTRSLDRKYKIATSSGGSSCEGGGLRRLFCSKDSIACLSSSQSNAEMKKDSDSNDVVPDGNVEEAEVRIIPIELIPASDGNQKQAMQEDFPAAPMKTPEKTSKKHTKHTQTPESNSKAHKRLEWDSAGDVGYPISKSTGNLSDLERVVLRAFFQKSLAEAAATQKQNTNASEGDLKRLEEELQQQKHIQSRATKTQYTNTPPLASSTLIESNGKARSATEIHPCLINRSTSTSLLRRYEKQIQTSLNRPQMASKEVQVHIASSVPSSMIGSSATNTSFDYYSSRSQSTDRSNNKNFIDDKLLTRLSGGADTDRSTSDKSGKETRRQRRKDLAESDKENENREVSATHSAVSLVSNSGSSVSCVMPEEPQLDLGIALVCSVIDAHSLNNDEKKKLIQQVVKRICGISGWEGGSKEFAVKALALNQQKETSHQSRKKDKSVLGPRNNAECQTNTRETRNVESNSAAYNFEVCAKSSPPTTSAKALEKLASEREARAKTKELEKRKHAGMEKSLPLDERAQKLTALKAGEVVCKTTRNMHSNVEKNYTAKSTAPRRKTMGETEEETETPTTAYEKTKRSENTTPDSTGTCLPTTSTSTATSATTTASTSKEEELITQKTVNNQYTSNTDLEQASMGEWLNPMTQSEIEYEERRRQFAKNAGKREKLSHKGKDATLNAERATQLNWIEKEIERLESLKGLLMKERCLTDTTDTSIVDTLMKKQQEEDSNEVNTVTTTPAKETSEATQSSNRIYDSVHTESSEHTSRMSGGEGTEGGIQEIEVIIEESNVDVLDLDENLKRTRERRRETQIVFGKRTEEEKLGFTGENANAAAKFRTVKETIVTNEEQLLSKVKEQKHEKPAAGAPTASTTSTAAAQRSRMDSPAESNTSESVSSFAHQRKREFIDHYHKKLKKHYEYLLQQQQQEHQRLQHQVLEQQRMLCQQQQTTGHYSVPYTAQRPHMHDAFPTEYCYPQHHHHYHREQQQPPSQSASAPPLPRHFEKQPHAVCSTSAAAHLDTCTVRNEQTGESTPVQSLFCASSEVSVPMGSNPQSSMPTTTHQYDDVSSGHDIIRNNCVGVQTGSSLQRTRPIFGPARKPTAYRTSNCGYLPQAVSSQTVCVQVKPKAMAYVIEFDKPEKKTKRKEKTAKENIKDKNETPSTSKNKENTQPSKSSSYTTVSSSNSVNGSKDNASKASGSNVKQSERSTNSTGTSKTSDTSTSSSTTTTTTTSSSSSTGSSSSSGFKLTGSFCTQDYGKNMTLTLQEHLQHAKPEFIAHSKNRKAILNEMQALRQAREREMREIIDNTSFNSLDRKLKHLPPPPTKQKRVFHTKEMRAMTEKRYKTLPETLARQQQDREEQRRRGNRLLRDLFNRRLQKRVRDGKLTLNHSNTVI